MKSSLVYWLALLLFVPAGLGAKQKPLVVASASIFADMADNISGGLLDVRSIVPIGGDPHIYEPTPGDAQLAAKAGLILKNGLTFEGWLNEVIENSGTRAIVRTITEGIAPIESDKYKNATDPHAWMDARLGLVYIENIKNALIEFDPDNADVYNFNYELYRRQLEDLDSKISAAIQSIPERQRVLITSHDAFRYYGKRYGLQVEAVLGTSTDSEAQTSDIMRLNTVIQENKVPAVFIETTVNPKLLKQIASDNKVVVGGQLYSDSIGNKDSPAPTYLKMLEYNTNTIVAALSRSAEERGIATAGKRPGAGRFVLYGLLGLLLVGGFLLVARRMNGG
ncbi:MAG: zinc ABC transporter substrate-binding protein [Lewinellaceae bacterium]|nr:zinc ABC transporter substrate-binding protein [Phaeodactylibacter sp.]MCB9038435.1 zinc ABC transporter substrate-binding protein [Lewinellaceae bacterium]